MTKYTVASRRSASGPEKQVPAIWRGIGCLMFIVIPLMSYAAATLFVQFAVDRDWPMPYQLMGYPVLPAWLMSAAALVPVVTFIQAQQNLWAILLATVFFIVVLGAIISYAYAVMYKYVGPPPLGPLDAPPPSFKVKRYKR
jgi:predicted lysophospholipase L1 biosynthesis ABC-type transport system permease subunit